MHYTRYVHIYVSHKSNCRIEHGQVVFVRVSCLPLVFSVCCYWCCCCLSYFPNRAFWGYHMKFPSRGDHLFETFDSHQQRHLSDEQHTHSEPLSLAKKSSGVPSKMSKRSVSAVASEPGLVCMCARLWYIFTYMYVGRYVRTCMYMGRYSRYVLVCTWVGTVDTYLYDCSTYVCV